MDGQVHCSLLDAGCVRPRLRSGPATTPVHPSDRRQPEPGKITRKGGRRPSRVTRSALAGDLARLHNGAPGGWSALAARAPGADRCGAQPVRRAAGQVARRRRRGPEGLSAAGGAQARNVPPEGPPGDRRELRRVRVSAAVARRLPGLVASQGPGALRAPLKQYGKFSPARLHQRCPPATDVRHSSAN